MLKGSLVAIATPMQADGSIDEATLRALVDWHIAEGTHGIVVVGTTGESPTVDYDEHCRLIDIVVAQGGFVEAAICLHRRGDSDQTTLQHVSSIR